MFKMADSRSPLQFRTMLLLIDNYDSFTYNLYQSLAKIGAEVEVVRNDEISVEAALGKRANGILLSPGPGLPKDAGICMDFLAALPPSQPLLGICLGHQALIESLGGELEIDPVPVHGKSAEIHHKQGCGMLDGIPTPFTAGRYHSIRAVRSALPSCLEETAWTADGIVMAVKHREYPWGGLQFHPESVLTPLGDDLMRRFAELVGEVPRESACA